MFGHMRGSFTGADKDRVGKFAAAGDGTLVLEHLAAIDKVDEFFEAIDSDDVARAKALLRRACVEPAAIAIVMA